jgi:hypothetical protein
MKRLFKVGDGYFANKTDAKVARGEAVNAQAVKEGAAPVYKFTIERGPDHWKSL